MHVETLYPLLVPHSLLVAAPKRILISLKTAPTQRTSRKPVTRQETSFKTNEIHIYLE